MSQAYRRSLNDGSALQVARPPLYTMAGAVGHDGRGAACLGIALLRRLATAIRPAILLTWFSGLPIRLTVLPMLQHLAARLRLMIATALESLWAHRGRTTLAMCGIIVGTMALAGVQMLSDGLNILAETELIRLGASEIRVVPSKWDRLDFVQFPRREVVHFTHDDAQRLSQSLPNGASVWIRDSGAVRGRMGTRERGISIIGLDADGPVAAHDPLRAGRLPEFGAGTKSDSDAVLVSFRLGRLLVDPGMPIERVVGARVELGGRLLRVVGVADSVAKAKFLVIWAQRGTARNLDPFAEEALVVRDVGATPPSLKALMARIERWIGENRPAWTEATVVSGRGASDLEGMRRRARLIRLSLSAFCLLTMFVAGTGIANVIFASVVERVREVGIRKAVGARFSDIFGQFLTESLALTALGTLVGIALGVALASAFAWFVRWDSGQPLYLELRTWTVVTSSSLALVTGILAGVVPSVRAARLAPSEAMRTE